MKLRLLVLALPLALLLASMPVVAQEQATSVIVRITPFEGPIGTDPVTTPVLVELIYFAAPNLAQQDMQVKLHIGAAPEWVDLAVIEPAEIVFKPILPPPSVTVKRVAHLNLTVSLKADAPANQPENLMVVATAKAALLTKAGEGMAETPVKAGEPVVPAAAPETPPELDEKTIPTPAPLVGIALTAALALGARRIPRRGR